MCLSLNLQWEKSANKFQLGLSATIYHCLHRLLKQCVIVKQEQEKNVKAEQPGTMGLRIRNQGGSPTERNGSFISQGSFKLNTVVKFFWKFTF